VTNPDPIARAWRLEKRRKELGSNDPQCFYCPENDVACMEVDHPVTEELDKEFKRIVCSNHHRKLETARDVAGLTKNGLRDIEESERDKLRRFLLLHAKDLESVAPLCPEHIAVQLRSSAASLRRKATTL
jgi:hypothetical protein